MRRLAATALLLALSVPAFAGWNPPGWEKSPPAEPEGAIGAGEAVANGLLHIYRSYVSPIDSGRCPSYPSCSAYALSAIKQYGPATGIMLTAGRLVSEADEGAFSPAVYKGRWLVNNPPERDMAFLKGEK